MFSHNRKQQVMYGLYVAWSIKEVNRTSLGSKDRVIYGQGFFSPTTLKPTISNTTISHHPLNQEPQPISRKDVHIIIQ